MSKPPIKITQSLTDQQKLQVSRLYFEAFDKKFIYLMNLPANPELAASIFVESFNFANGHYAICGDEVLGAVALITGKQFFAHFTYPPLRKHFNFFGAAARAFGYWLFSLFSTRPKEDEVLIDALFVSSKSRGMGIGTLLLQHAEEYARSIGCTKLILGVIDTNEGAKRLYERYGFEEYKYEKSGWFTKRAGFTGDYLMRKVLE